MIREGATDDHESLPQMDFPTIVDATENFSHQIGKGGFGNVYKVNYSTEKVTLEMEIKDVKHKLLETGIVSRWDRDCCEETVGAVKSRHRGVLYRGDINPTAQTREHRPTLWLECSQ